jgi:predicted GIY-YIG superfamily endonuclease
MISNKSKPSKTIIVTDNVCNDNLEDICDGIDNINHDINHDINHEINHKNHFCYILRNTHQPDINRTYNGYTNNPIKRIRQHNQEIKGGAVYTKQWGGKSWEFCAILKGFPDHQNALQCEWRIKHPAPKKIRPMRYNSPEGRIMGLNEILHLEKWTSKTNVPISELKLDLWILGEYAALLKDIPSNIIVKIVDKIDPMAI